MNPNIAMGFQQPYFDPQEGQRNALAMRQAQMQEATQLMQMQQAQQAAQREGARRNALASADWNSPESLTQARGALGQQGDIDGVMAIDNHIRSISKDRRDAAIAEIDAIPKLAGGLSNPETYQQTRAMAARVAPDFYAGLPEAFDPQIVDPINRAAMSATDWRNQQNTDRTFNAQQEKDASSAAFGREKFDYEQRRDAEKAQILRDKNDATNNGAKAATLSNEAGLRKEFDAGSKDFVTVKNAYKRVQQAGAKPSAAGDMAMVYSIMKMFDPNSVVRETEYATAQNAAGVPDQIRNTWQKLLDGQRLAPAQRQDFINTARGLMESQLGEHQNYRSEIARIAEESGIVPTKVIIDYTKGLSLEPQKPTETAQSVPGVGAVKKGYQFMGGDPNDPTSWRKLSK